MAPRVHFMFRKSYWKRKERLEKARKAAKAAAKAERKLKKRRLRGLDPPHERKIFSKKRGNEILDSCTKEMTLGGEHIVYNVYGTTLQPATTQRTLNTLLERVRPDKGLDATTIEISSAQGFRGYEKRRISLANCGTRWPVAFTFIAAAILPPHNAYAVVIDYRDVQAHPCDIRYWAWCAIAQAAPELSDEYIEYLLKYLLISRPDDIRGLEGLYDHDWLWDDIQRMTKLPNQDPRRVQTIVVINADPQLRHYQWSGERKASPIIQKLNKLACRLGASYLIVDSGRRIVPEQDVDVRIMLNDPERAMKQLDTGMTTRFDGYMYGAVERIQTGMKLRFEGTILPHGTVVDVEQIPSLPADRAGVALQEMALADRK